MKQLSDYFIGIGYKRLSLVEVDPAVSHQHEFNGVSKFKKLFGTDKRTFKGKYIYLTDDQESTIEEFGTLTWYDSRENDTSRTEFRLFYSSNEIISNAKAGDLLLILWKSQDELWIIVTPQGSTSEQQLIWLFDINESGVIQIKKEIADKHEDYSKNFILNLLGIEPEIEEDGYLNEMINLYENDFPSTTEFFKYTLSNIKELSLEDPDLALVTLFQKEEYLFRIFEKYLVRKQLEIGFGHDGKDVDEFISYSLKVQNRRKSRAGFSFENKISYILKYHNIKFSHGSITENKKKPDFIFPNIDYYNDMNFKATYLIMLGAKTTAKDRWRQIISEADRITNKHLITLEPSISISQTDEMKSQKIILVIPSSIQPTFRPSQLLDIINFQTFIDTVKEKERLAGI